jgi:hypothetical protein
MSQEHVNGETPDRIKPRQQTLQGRWAAALDAHRPFGMTAAFRPLR